jgi:murein DD-endopeptidase MepM/ murein hydrolase activator NlpD
VSDSASSRPPSNISGFFKFISDLADSLGLQRFTGHAILLAVVAGMLWLGRMNLPGQLPASFDIGAVSEFNQTPPTPTAAAPTISEAAVPMLVPTDSGDLTRETEIHTDIPTRPRTEIATYTVQEGDTLFGIAEKFGLTPETIMWGNPSMKDDPHLLRPGQELRIPPTNGVLHVVDPSNTIEGLALLFGVEPDIIINWPGNDIDFEDPKLEPGQLLMVPGGHREFVQWVVPQIVRTVRNALPASAGPGACPGGYSGGAVGGGGFIWPANNHYLSGNNYWSGHLGLDIAAGLGAPIYASDGGVAVFAGWSNWGYGNMVVIDHGNGWQTLYAHLSQWNVSCGQSLLQGNIVGLAGSTGNSSGPHLHFEMNYNGSRPNPWNYLPAP